MNVGELVAFLDGGRVAFAVIIALAFARLGRATSERLYHAFAAAFLLLALNSSLVGLDVAFGDHSELAYIPRLLAFTMIIIAIIDKNRRAARGGEPR